MLRTGLGIDEEIPIDDDDDERPTVEQKPACDEYGGWESDEKEWREVVSLTMRLNDKSFIYVEKPRSYQATDEIETYHGATRSRFMLSDKVVRKIRRFFYCYVSLHLKSQLSFHSFPNLATIFTFFPCTKLCTVQRPGNRALSQYRNGK